MSKSELIAQIIEAAIRLGPGAIELVAAIRRPDGSLDVFSTLAEVDAESNENLRKIAERLRSKTGQGGGQ